MSRQFKIGDRVRSMDFRPMPGRAPCYVEAIINEILPDTGRYSGTCVKDVWIGEEVTEGSRVGVRVAFPMEGRQLRDYSERLALVATFDDEKKLPIAALFEDREVLR